MPAGFVNLSIADANGTLRNQQMWSSDGTLAGNLTATPFGSQSASNSVPVTLANDGVFAAVTGTTTDAVYASNDGSAAGTIVSILKSIFVALKNLISVDTVVKAVSVSRSGTIATGNTQQQLMPANSSRRGIIIQNQSSGDLYINSLANATLDQNSLRIPSGALYASDPHHAGTGAISIIGATTGQAFYAREF